MSDSTQLSCSLDLNVGEETDYLFGPLSRHAFHIDRLAITFFAPTFSGTVQPDAFLVLLALKFSIIRSARQFLILQRSEFRTHHIVLKRL